MPHQKQLLLIFVKNPLPGKVKTRLARHIGNEGAVKAYHKLLNITKNAALNANCESRAYYGDFVNREDLWSEPQFEKKLQKGNNLGQRMNNAFKTAFNDGYHKVVIIGSDCPEITGEIINRAFELMDSSEVVVGPAADGGYYLLGMRKYHNLFEKKQWSTSSVLQDTVNDLEQKEISYQMLTVLSDLDTIEELKKFPHLHDASN